MKIAIKVFLPIIIIHTIIWYISYYFLSINDIYGYYTGFWSFIYNNQGEYYATILMTFISLNILLSTRLKFIEKIFSGLDKVYVVHKYLAYFIFLLIILHNALIYSSHTFYTGFFTFAKNIANPLMYLFFALIIISALPHIPFIKKIFNIPYHIWKYTHYLMGILFLVGIYHSIGVNSFTFNNITLSIYMYMVYSIGVLALLYKSFLYNIFKNKYKYIVSNIKKYENDALIEIYLSPKNNKNILNWKAGQFAFFQFLQTGIREIHPFTISNLANVNGEIRLSIKNLGDWTKKIISELKENTEVKISDPYGNFISQKEKNNLEVWIAGGIGITPFLAMLNNYKLNNNLNKNIIFVWSVKNEFEAIYKEEILNNLPDNINFILHDTSKSGFFKFKNIENNINNTLSLNYQNDKDNTKENKDKLKEYKNTAVYICGPKSLRESIIKDTKFLNIQNVNFEEFNFR